MTFQTQPNPSIQLLPKSDSDVPVKVGFSKFDVSRIHKATYRQRATSSLSPGTARNTLKKSAGGLHFNASQVRVRNPYFDTWLKETVLPPLMESLGVKEAAEQDVGIKLRKFSIFAAGEVDPDGHKK